jgi:hypothetical protein
MPESARDVLARSPTNSQLVAWRETVTLRMSQRRLVTLSLSKRRLVTLSLSKRRLVTLSLSKRRRDLALLRWPFDCAPEPVLSLRRGAPLTVTTLLRWPFDCSTSRGRRFAG